MLDSVGLAAAWHFHASTSLSVVSHVSAAWGLPRRQGPEPAVFSPLQRGKVRQTHAFKFQQRL
jgi:hypothetical protein